METQETTNIVKFDIESCKAKTARLIISKCQEWNCTPEEAIKRLMDMVAGDDNNPTEEAA